MCQSLFLIKKLKKETLAQVFSSEFCEISTEHRQTIASEFINNYLQISEFFLISVHSIFTSEKVNSIAYFTLCHFAVSMQCRSSRTEVFCKKCALRNVAKFTGKHLCQSLFRATLLRRRLWHRCFSVNFAKFLRTLFLTEHLRWMLLAVLESAEQRVSVTCFTILLAPCCSSIVCFASFQIFIRWFI